MIFGFLKDVYLELNGVDTRFVEEERKKKLEEKKKNKFIFSSSTKVAVYVFGIIYLILTAGNIISLKKSDALSFAHLLRYFFLVVCDISAMGCLIVKSKKTEIAALILIVIFVLVQYFTTLLMW